MCECVCYVHESGATGAHRSIRLVSNQLQRPAWRSAAGHKAGQPLRCRGGSSAVATRPSECTAKAGFSGLLRARHGVGNMATVLTSHPDAIGSVRPRARTLKQDRPRCGAKTRAGAPCRARVVWDDVLYRPRNGRCRMHGGLSTGPRTEEGRRRVAESNRRRARPTYKEADAPDA